MKKSKLGLLFLSSLALVTGVASTGVAGVLANQSNVSVVRAVSTTYRHIFSAKPATGNNVTLSGMKWNISANNLNGYQSSYGGVQFGTKSSNGNITLVSSNSLKSVSEVRLWLNVGGTSVTPSVSVGTDSVDSDGVTVTKKTSVSSWANTNKVTFSLGTAKDGVVTIGVSSVNAGYICAIEIDYDNESETPSEVPVTGVTLDKTSMALNEGDTGTLTATVAPENATDSTYSWSSSDSSVATVSTSGLVTAVSSGTAVITVTTTNGNKTASCVVTVSQVVEYDEVIEFSSISNFGDWGTGYTEKKATFGNADVILTAAAKSTTTITNMPVSKGGEVIVKLNNNKTFKDLHFSFEQWGTKTQTLSLFTSSDKGETFSTEALVTSKNFSLDASDLSEVNAIKVTMSSSTNQIGVDSLSFNYGDDMQVSSLSMKNVLPEYCAVYEEIAFTPIFEGMSASDISYSVSDDKGYVDNGKLHVIESGTITVTASATINGKEYSSSTTIEAYDVLTITEAKEITDVLEINGVTSEKYLIEGFVTNFASNGDTNGRCYISDGVNFAYIYGTTKSKDGTVSWSSFADSDKYEVGNKVRFFGNLVNYNGNPEIKDAWVYSIDKSFDVSSVVASQGTKSSLAYNYSKDEEGNYSYTVKKSNGENYSYEAVAIRLGGMLHYNNQWRALDATSGGITSYGVNVVYEDIDGSIKEKDVSWDVETDGVMRTDDGVTVSDKGAYVLFNARLVVPANKWNVEFVATSYVMTLNKGKIELESTDEVSVKSLAASYIDKKDELNLSEAYLQSLQGIVDGK